MSIEGHGKVRVDATVPWRFSSSGEFSQWLWDTHDFEALVMCDSDAWTWQITTKDSERLAAGTGLDFDTCCDQVLEAIGKAYPLEAGYDRWTHNAARKYNLAGGVRVDLAAGDQVMVRVFLDDGSHLDGRLLLGDWVMHLEVEESDDYVTVWDIEPAHVRSVVRLP